jgi:hypothetical protein
LADILERRRLGMSMAAMMAMIATTIMSSIRVKPLRDGLVIEGSLKGSNSAGPYAPTLGKEAILVRESAMEVKPIPDKLSVDPARGGPYNRAP